MRSKVKHVCAALVAVVMLTACACAQNEEPSPTPTLTPSSTAMPAPSASAKATATPKPKLQIDPNAGERVTPTPSPTPRPARGIKIIGWTDLSFDSRAEELWFDLYNPEVNAPTEEADGFYLTFTFSIMHETVNAETGETEIIYDELFSTGLVPPGQAVNTVTLTHTVEKGEYDALMFVQPYTMETLEACSATRFPIHLTVY